MASHRKPRTTGQLVAGLRTSPAVGFTAAALTSVALMSQTAAAAPAEPKPSLEEVQKKVDDLYRQAGVATQKYNAAQERTDEQRKHVDGLLDDVAKRTEKLNEARRELGSFAAAQYRTGGVSDTATLLLAEDPQEYFDQSQLMSRLTNRQKEAVDDYQTQQIETTKKREEATESLASLTESQADLKASKQDVQQKLSEARELLSKLTAEEKARLAAIEKAKEEEARRKAEELARRQAEEERQRQEAQAQAEQEQAEQEQAEQEAATGSGTGTGSDSGSTGSSSYATMAAKVIDFAEAQIGKPYVWGATGPESYDWSGLTQAAWKTAGVSLPRTTWDQVKVGTTVSVDNAEPGDLVFFYDDISHVGIYIGNGEMIHAPKPGANVRVESIYYMPIHSVVRPA
ncbi:C40 family peptidase [Streptomyces sp. PSKA54]|uniref:C40 family peptidase n=1 Tax=Streptomyces himalayensis subsp. aureolus TaxID=2758039 RepID=A0A7W2HF05_9ACTN|nr:C40 family peptidase [Streptomyces himalayensis]MBA4861478.1 C40 family peptidase [Streptomyces himalayensis subsp. aureolus]